MRYIFLLSILFATVLQGQSLSDTTFLDAKFKRCPRDLSVVYRLISEHDTHYHVTDYYKDGTIEMEGAYLSLNPEIKDGHFIYYYNTGRKRNECQYSLNKLDGISKNYDYVSGILLRSEKFKKGLKNGEDTRHSYQGTENTYYYINDTLLNNNGKSDFMVGIEIENVAFHAGCHEGDVLSSLLKKTLSANLILPNGRVAVKFTIDENGYPINIKPVKPDNEELTGIISKAISEYGKWCGEIVLDSLVKTPMIVVVNMPKLSVAVNRDYSHIETEEEKSTKDLANKLQKYFDGNESRISLRDDTAMQGITILKFEVSMDRKVSEVIVLRSENKLQTDSLVKSLIDSPFKGGVLIEGVASTPMVYIYAYLPIGNVILSQPKPH